MSISANVIKGHQITWHAWVRMKERGITEEQVQLALQHGRQYRQKEAHVYALWQDELDRVKRRGINADGCKGVHVVCGHYGEVVTVYRRQNLFENSRNCFWH